MNSCAEHPSCTLLLADSDQATCSKMEDFLSQHGFQVILANTGQQVIELFSTASIDLVLLSAELSAMNDFELCKEIITFDEQAVVLMTIGTEDHDLMDHALAAGVTDIFTKPLHLQILLRRLNSLCFVKQETLRLQRSEARFQKLFEDAPLAYQSLNEAGEILNVNSAWSELLGYSRNEMIGKPFELLVVSDSLQHPFCERFNTFKQMGRVNNASLTVISKSGQHIDIEINGRISNNHGLKHSQCVLVNVTERKQREADMKKLTCALDQAGSGVLITDLSGAIQYVNKEFSNITGYFLEEIVGKNPSILQSGKQAPVFYKKMWQTILDQGEWSGDF